MPSMSQTRSQSRLRQAQRLGGRIRPAAWERLITRAPASRRWPLNKASDFNRREGGSFSTGLDSHPRIALVEGLYRRRFGEARQSTV
jgi:hypothetical protein